MAGGEDDEGPYISPEDRARFERAAHQVVAYANFLRWCANFQRDEVIFHANHHNVVLLSPMMSGRFSFAVEDDRLLLGVQHFEAAWVVPMPFTAAYVSDRLYLSIDRVNCMDAKIPALVLGIFVDEKLKRHHMANVKSVQPVAVTVDEGRVVSVGAPLARSFPMRPGEIITEMQSAAAQKLAAQDISRFL